MKKFNALCLRLLLPVVCVCCGVDMRAAVPQRQSADASEFVLLTDVVPDAIFEIRYYGTYNFIGERVAGYEAPVALLTREAADSLKKVSDDLLAQGYRLKIWDGYRPQKAVDQFMAWAKDLADTRMKPYFYAELTKDRIIPEDYVAEKSGHTRGSTVDLTLFDMRKGKDVDMGSTFDYFGAISHPDVKPGQQAGAYPTTLTAEQYANRMILRKAMLAHGFKPLESEWWHFTLKKEPFPGTYFTFPVSMTSVNQVVEKQSNKVTDRSR